MLNTKTVKIPADYITAKELNNKSPEVKLPLLAAGAKAPDWKLKDINGVVLTSANLKERVVLIDFCGLGCAPCIMTEPIIARLREKYKNANVKIITVSIDKGKASALTLSKKTNYTVFMDGRGMYNDFHGNGIPLFYLVDKQGLIATRHDGYSYELEEQLTAEIEKIK